MIASLAGFSIIIVLFLVVLAFLWFLLPFAIFGTKDLLKELIAEQKKTNELLAGAPRETPVYLVRK